MIAAGSLVGFAVLWLLGAWTLSALAVACLRASRHALERAGPAASRAGAALAVLVPPVLAFAIVAVLAGHSLVAAWQGDHCDHHAHHAHLCLVHGSAWVGVTWAITALATFGAAVVFLTARGLWVRRRQRRHAAVLETFGVVAAMIDGVPVTVLPSETPFAFVTGVRRPRILVSEGVWAHLDELGRAAMIEHELAHVRQRDLVWGAVLAWFARLGLPVVAGRALLTWRRATERLCDLRAAHRVSSLAVAQALVDLVRLGAPARGPVTAFAGESRDVAARVEHVLREGPDGLRASRRLVLVASGLLLAAPATLVALAEPAHHALETLLGAL